MTHSAYGARPGRWVESDKWKMRRRNCTAFLVRNVCTCTDIQLLFNPWTNAYKSIISMFFGLNVCIYQKSEQIPVNQYSESCNNSYFCFVSMDNAQLSCLSLTWIFHKSYIGKWRSNACMRWRREVTTLSGRSVCYWDFQGNHDSQWIRDLFEFTTILLPRQPSFGKLRCRHIWGQCEVWRNFCDGIELIFGSLAFVSIILFSARTSSSCEASPSVSRTAVNSCVEHHRAPPIFNNYRKAIIFGILSLFCLQLRHVAHVWCGVCDQLRCWKRYYNHHTTAVKRAS